MSKGARDGRTFGTMITDDVQYTIYTILSYGRFADPVLIDFVEYVTKLVGGAVEDIKKNKEEVKVNTERTKDKKRKMNDKIDDDKKERRERFEHEQSIILVQLPWLRREGAAHQGV